MTRTLYLDCDGVLADFDGGVVRLSGMNAEALTDRLGVGGFWRELAKADGFYEHLDPLPGALAMVEAVRHLDPVILTGLPLGKWAEPQKRAWAKRHFPDLRVITCMARDKWRYATPGDVLVDDREKARQPWEKAGGLFVLHEDPESSLVTLSEIYDL